MTVRNVKKNLAGQQDLLPGLGPYEQIRRGQTVTVDGPAKSYFDLFVRSYAEAGLPVKGTFEDGCTLDTVDDIAIHLAEGKGYSYSGTLPHTIGAGETPIGNHLWVAKSSKTMRSYLATAIIYVRLQGGTFDGVINNTAAIMQAHTAANLLNATVSYAGIKDYAIDANARIPVNTNVDFCGARAHILNGMVIPPTWTAFLATYVVENPQTPIVTATGTFTGSLVAGSLTPTKGLFNGDGYALIRAPYQIPDRKGTGTVDYEQSFCVVRDGLAVRPLSVDLTAYSAGLVVKYRKNSSHIKLSSPSLVDGGFNNLHFIEVNRCNVSVDDFYFEHSPANNNLDTVNELLFIHYAANVYINGVNSTGQPTQGTSGSYVLKVDYAAEIYLDKLRSIWRGWYSLAAFHVNGMVATRCALDRLDAHAGGHNIYADGCLFSVLGVVYGWGGGEIRVTNSTLVNSNSGTGIVSSRVDYGGNFFGDIYVDGITLSNNVTVDAPILHIKAGASITTYLPNSIIIGDVRWAGLGKSAYGNRLTASVSKTVGATGGVIAPKLIEVTNVSSSVNSYFALTADFGNFMIRPGAVRHDIALRSIVCSSAPTINKGVVITAGGDPALQLIINIGDSDHILINAEGSQCVREINMDNCGVCGVDVQSGNTYTPQVRLNDCEFRYIANGYPGLVPVGGVDFANDKFTSITGGAVWYAGFDLSRVASSKGLLMLKGSGTSPALPASWIPDDMFNGRKSATRFRSTT